MDIKFIEIFNLYKNDIYRLSYSYTKNKNHADDIVQNVFLKLYKNKKILEQDSLCIKKWLVKVTINECKTLFLSSWYRKTTGLSEKEEKLCKEEPTNEFLDAVLKLPKKYRLVILLYYYYGYKTKEIAQILKTNENNVQTIMYRSRNQLKDFLKEDK